MTTPAPKHPWRASEGDRPKCSKCHTRRAATRDGKLCRTCLRAMIREDNPLPPNRRWEEHIGRPALPNHDAPNFDISEED